MVHGKLAALRERVAARKESVEQKRFQRELRRSKRREKVRRAKETVREKARGATAPARIEAKATAEEARKLREEADPKVVPGGETAVKAGAVAGEAARRGGAAAAKGAKRGGKVAARSAKEAVAEARERAREADLDTTAGDFGEEPEDVFARAERTATMADPVGASLEPTTTIENVQFMAGAGGLGLGGAPVDDGRMPEATALAMPDDSPAPAHGETVGEGLDAGLSVTGGEDQGDGPDLDGEISLLGEVDDEGGLL